MVQRNTKNNNLPTKTAKTHKVLTQQERQQVYKCMKQLCKAMEEAYANDDEFHVRDHLLPVQGKKPYKHEWQKTTTEKNSIITELANGVATGYGIKPNYRFVFLDCDGQSAIDAVDSWLTDPDDKHALQNTVSQTSGKEGRKTYMFKATEDSVDFFNELIGGGKNKLIIPTKTYTDDDGKTHHEQVEVFYGSSSQVVGIGSYHPDTGKPYQAINSADDCHFYPIPDELAVQIGYEINKGKQSKKSNSSKSSKSTKRKSSKSSNSSKSKPKNKRANTSRTVQAILELNEPHWQVYNNIDHEFSINAGGTQARGYCPSPNCTHDNDGGSTFVVNIDPNEDEEYLTWYCHGCKIGGNVIHYEAFCEGEDVDSIKNGQNPKLYKQYAKQLEQRLGVTSSVESKRNFYQPKTFDTIERYISRWLESESFIVVNDEFYKYTGKGYWRLVQNDEVKCIIASHLDQCYDIERSESGDDDDDEDDSDKKQKNSRTGNGVRTKAPTQEQEEEQAQNTDNDDDVNDDVDEEDKVYKYATNNNLDKCFKYAKSMLNKRMSLPANKHLICFANGTYDIKLDKLCEHNKEDYLFWSIPYDYNENDTTPKQFLEFLHNAVGEDQIKLVQAWTRCLLDVSAPYGKFVHLLGQSGCGKGTLLRVWSNLFDESNCTAQSNLSVLNDADKRHQYLTDTRFYYSPDCKGYIQGLEAFYELVDNGKLSGRKLHSSDSYNKQWDCRFAIASVRQLKIENSGDGWQRRCIPIAFNPKPSNPDYFLGQKLEQELGQIVAWALSMSFEEMMDTIYNAQNNTDKQQELQIEQLVSSDSVAGFINAMLLPADKAQTLGYIDEVEAEELKGDFTADDLYHGYYKPYCVYVGCNAKSRDQFAQSLRSLIPDYYVPRQRQRQGNKRVSIPAHFKGLILNPNAVSKDGEFAPKQAYDYGLDAFEGKAPNLVTVTGEEKQDVEEKQAQEAPNTISYAFDDLMQMIDANVGNVYKLQQIKNIVNGDGVFLSSGQRKELLETIKMAEEW